RVFGPRPFKDLKGLGEALLAFAIRDAIGLVRARKAATPDAENEPTMTDLVDRRGFLADPRRMAQREHLDTRADLDAAGTCGNSAGDRQWHRANRPLPRGVDLA